MPYLSDSDQKLPQFITMGQYLDANQPAVNNTANGIAGDLSSGADAVRSGITNDVNAQTAPTNVVSAGPTRTYGPNNTPIQRQTYAGPGSIDLSGDEEKAAQQMGTAQLAGTQSGLAQLIGNKYGGGGNPMFDSGLIWSSGPAASTISGAAAKSNDLSGFLDSQRASGNKILTSQHNGVLANDSLYDAHPSGTSEGIGQRTFGARPAQPSGWNGGGAVDHTRKAPDPAPPLTSTGPGIGQSWSNYDWQKSMTDQAKPAQAPKPAPVNTTAAPHDDTAPAGWNGNSTTQRKLTKWPF